MTTKLITSKSYIDELRNFLPENPNSKTPASVKSTKLFEKIINSPNFIFDKSDKRITDSITTLITIRPGRTLFKRLLKADKPLHIIFNSEENPCCIYNKEAKESAVILNDSKSVHVISANPDGEKFFAPDPDFIILAHELIHALHYFEEGKAFVDKKLESQNILDPSLDNLEEQETIIGKEREGMLCENVFRFHFGYPLRIDHQGITLDKGKSFTATDCASMGILGSLKEKIASCPFFLNLSQDCTGTEIQMTPLNASITYHQVVISDYLFQAGVDIDAQDAYVGTALHVAVRTKQPDVVKVLLEKGAAVDVKNPEGFTALHLAVNTNQPDLVKMLVNKADINCTDLEGNTPLMSCCDSKVVDEKIEEFIILLGNDHLDINAKNIHGDSALSLALKTKKHWQAYVLLRKGAEVPLFWEKEVEQCIDMYT